jgi:hypothetical protein
VAKWKDETIIDDPSPGRGVKVVEHTKLEYEMVYANNRDTKTDYGSPSASHNSYEGPGAYWAIWQHDGVSTAGVPYRFGYLPVAHLAYTPDRDTDSLVRDTVHAFYDQNQTDNLLNLIEAPQLIDSLASIANSVRRLRQSIIREGLLQQLAFLRGSWGKARIRTLLSRLHVANARASDLYLVYSFGVAPLVSDMKKIQREIKTLRSRLKREIDRNTNKMVSVHRSCGYDLYYTHDGTRPKSMFANGFEWTINRSNTDSKRTCTVRGFRNSGYESNSYKKLDYLMSRFGVSGPATLTWEIIPWSFVVDWFLDLRHITDSLDNLLTGSRKRIVDICISDKIVFEQDAAQAGAHIITPPVGTKMVKLKTSIYTRNPVTSYNKVGFSGRFGKKQASLSAALLYQQIAKLGR